MRQNTANKVQNAANIGNIQQIWIHECHRFNHCFNHRFNVRFKNGLLNEDNTQVEELS